ARFFLEEETVPAVLVVEGVRPFELYGCPSTVIWQTNRRPGPLATCSGRGVNVIGFIHPSVFDLKHPPKVVPPRWRFIQYSPDRKTARTIINRHSGNMNADGILLTLRKTGDDWFVVDFRMAYAA